MLVAWVLVHDLGATFDPCSCKLLFVGRLSLTLPDLVQKKGKVSDRQHSIQICMHVFVSKVTPTLWKVSRGTHPSVRKRIYRLGKQSDTNQPNTPGRSHIRPILRYVNVSPIEEPVSRPTSKVTSYPTIVSIRLLRKNVVPTIFPTNDL